MCECKSKCKPKCCSERNSNRESDPRRNLEDSYERERVRARSLSLLFYQLIANCKSK